LNQTEQQLYDKAIQTIRAQQQALENLTAPSYPVGTVLAVFDKSVLISLNNGLFEAERPSGTEKAWVGRTIQVHPKTGQIVKLASAGPRYGATATVTQVSGSMVVLTVSQGEFSTEYSAIPVGELAIGDHVALDSTNLVILHKIESQSKYAYQTQSPLDWSDVGGCAEAKAELRKALELPFSHSSVFSFFHQQRIKGGLLWGRPGNGKTLLGRCCAGAISRAHGREGADTGFLYVKGPELLSKWVGEPEAAVRGLFGHAKLHFKKHGYPAVIFIDEADALLMRRGMRTASGMEQTMVPMFNAEMDGMEESGAFVLLATNRADALDPAITRPGRIDRKFYIGPPTKESAPEVFSIHMRDVPVALDCSKEQLIAAANEGFFSSKYPLYRIETNKGARIFNLGHLASGAMVAGLVERAVSCAIDRNIALAPGSAADPKDCPPFDGLREADFSTALVAMHQSEFGINHFDELKEFIDSEKVEVLGIAPCRTPEETTAAPPAMAEAPKVVAVAMPSGKRNYDA
jgi:proteasome-associated ATPase